jgi:hypothetical protein
MGIFWNRFIFTTDGVLLVRGEEISKKNFDDYEPFFNVYKLAL